MFTTTTPFPAPEPGEYLDFQQFADLAELSIFTVRTQWEQYKMPFELIGGRRLISRAAADKWIVDRAKASLDKMSSVQAEAMWQAMNERRAAMGRK